MWAAERGLDSEDEIAYSNERLYLVLAQLELERDGGAGDSASAGRAIRLLERLRVAAQRDCRMGDVLECLALEALAFDQTGDAARSRQSLEKALSLVVSESAFRVFIDRGAPMRRLLQAASKRGFLPDAASSLCAMFDADPDSVPVSGRPQASSARARVDDLLTERELDLLRLIQKGHSNAEIAETLFISQNTVKTHIKNLYQKLNAGNRTQALAHAREFGILT